MAATYTKINVKVVGDEKEGFGMVAAQDLKNTSVILDELPLYMTTNRQSEKLGFPTYVWHLTDMVIADRFHSSLTAFERDEFVTTLPVWDEEDHAWATTLSKKHHIEYSDVKRTYALVVKYNIVQTIVYSVSGETRTLHIATLYALNCLINHSCEPNAKWVSEDVHGAIDTDEVKISGRKKVVAIRDIPIHTPITVSYISGDFQHLNFIKRRLLLLHAHGFVCRCDRCVREAKEAAVPSAPTTVSSAS